MLKQLIIILIATFISGKCFSVSVINVTSKQIGQTIEIWYDITGSNEEDRFNIALFCSIDGGKTYSPALIHVEGDVGYNLEGGFGKKIIWNVLDEMNHLIAKEVVFKVRVDYLPEEARNLIFIKGGEFMMGRSNGSNDEIPVHEVILEDYYIGKYEVTVKEYKKFCDESDYLMPDKNLEWGDNHPITFIDWFDANAYCQWLSNKTGKKFRLPTEAEWEFAARGGINSNNYFYAGSDNINDVGWYKTNSEGVTHSKVGNLSPNELNINDMSGNVWEWCYDWYSEKYYEQSPSNNPKGPRIGTLKTGRGGSWHDPAVPVTYRFYMSSTAGSNFMGFRVVMEP